MAALCVALAACSGGEEAQQQAQRRELLTVPDRSDELEALREKRRVYDAEGNLIPSGEVVAGVELPRGLELYRSFEGEWYYRTFKIRSEDLVRYFKPRLFTGQVNYTLNAAVTFKNARSKDFPEAPPIDVRIAKKRGGATISDVYIRQHQPPERKQWPSQAESEAQLEAMRRHAD
ncbi:MAG: hypothetical protein PVI30_23720 [Myxococcales bacterium]|jgi:hypothetical protein